MMTKIVDNRSYYIPRSDESNGQMCFIQGQLIMLPIKKILFPSSFWGIFDFFVLFMILKKNKGILRYNGGTSTTTGKILQWPKVLRRKGKLLLG
jgi:hypothetical protein